MAITYDDTTLFEQHLVKATNSPPDFTVIDGCISRAVDIGAQHWQPPLAGSLLPRIAGHAFGRPSITFQTLDLELLLKPVGGTDYGMGLSIAVGYPLGDQVDPTGPTLEAYWVAKQALGGYAAGAIHRKVTITDGIIVLDGLVVGQDAIAIGSCTAWGMLAGALPYAGAADDPMTFTDSIALASLPTVPAISTFWTMGPVYIDGTQLKLATGWSFSPGLTLQMIPHSGDPFPRLAHFVTAAPPTFTIQLAKPTPLNELGITGLGTFGRTAGAGVLAKTATFSLWKVNAFDSGREGYAETVHMTLKIHEGKITAVPVGGSPQSPLVNQLTLEAFAATGTSSTDLMTVATGVAIPTA